jgi:Ca2+-binding EF-hand superfamily protein
MNGRETMSIEATGTKNNPLGAMLDKAFNKFDQDGDGKLDKSEFASFNEILKPGIAVDADGKPTTDYSETMDENSDGSITKDEMENTPVLPAALTSDNFGSMISYLKLQDTPEALEAASILGDRTTDGA